MKAKRQFSKSLKEYDQSASCYVVKPFMSNSLIDYFNMEGGSKCLLRYLEYLTIKCNVSSKQLHTELGCLYVRCIVSLVKKLDDKSMEAVKKIDQIQTLKNKLREFLFKSMLYKAVEIE